VTFNKRLANYARLTWKRSKGGIVEVADIKIGRSYYWLLDQWHEWRLYTNTK
jgi:hypothetical protein